MIVANPSIETCSRRKRSVAGGFPPSGSPVSEAVSRRARGRPLLVLLFLLLAAVVAPAQSSKKNGLTGWDYFQQKNYAVALELLEKDRRMWPESHEIIDGIGWCLFYLGRLDEAEKSFRQALAIAPDYRFSKMGIEAVANARLGPLLRAEASLTAGRYEEARKGFDAFIRSNDAADARTLARARRGRGFACYHLKRYNEALKDFTRVLRVDPNDARALVGIGYVQFARRRWSEAEPALKKALELDPSNLVARLTWAWTSFNRGRINEALARFQEAARRVPSSWGAWLGVGWCQDKKGDETAAREAFTRALRLSSQAMTAELSNWIRRKSSRRSLQLEYGFALIEDGSDAVARSVFQSLPRDLEPDMVALGEALAALHLGDNLGASRIAGSLLDRGRDPVRSLRTAIKDPARSNQARVQVSASTVAGWAALRLGEVEEAQRRFETASSLPGDWSDAVCGLGWVALARKEYVRAEECFLQVLERLPGYLPATTGMQSVTSWRYEDYNRGWAALNAGELENARSIFQSLRSDPKHRFPAARVDLIDYSLGVVARRRGDVKAALRHFEAARKANPLLSEAVVGLGWALLESGRDRQAVEILEEAVRLRPYDAEPHRLLARALESAGREEEAIARLQQWVKRFTTDADLHERLGGLLFERKRFVESRIAYATVLSVDPDRFPENELRKLFEHEEFNALHGVLGWAYHSRGRYKDAVREFRIAVKLEPGERLHRKGLALSLAASGSIDEAWKAADAYLETLGRSAADLAEKRSVMMTLGWSAYTAGHHRRALKAFQQVEKTDKSRAADVMNALGWTWLRLNKPLRAREYFLKALAVLPRLESALSGLEAVNGVLKK